MAWPLFGGADAWPGISHGRSHLLFVSYRSVYHHRCQNSATKHKGCLANLRYCTRSDCYSATLTLLRCPRRRRCIGCTPRCVALPRRLWTRFYHVLPVLPVVVPDEQETEKRTLKIV